MAWLENTPAARVRPFTCKKRALLRISVNNAFTNLALSVKNESPILAKVPFFVVDIDVITTSNCLLLTTVPSSIFNVSSISYVLSTPQSPLSARIATDGNRCPLIFV